MFVRNPIARLTKPMITLNLVNNTTDVLPVSILSSSNPTDISNQSTVYSWNLSAAVYANPVRITFWPVNFPLGFRTLTGNMGSLSAEGLVQFLNSLAIGKFWLSGTTLKTASDTVVFDNIDLGTVASTFLQSLSSGTTLIMDVNGINQVNRTAPPALGGITVNDGDLITGSTSKGVPYTVTVERTLKVPPFTVETVFTDTNTGLINLPSITIDGAYYYTIDT